MLPKLHQQEPVLLEGLSFRLIDRHGEPFKATLTKTTHNMICIYNTT